VPEIDITIRVWVQPQPNGYDVVRAPYPATITRYLDGSGNVKVLAPDKTLVEHHFTNIEEEQPLLAELIDLAFAQAVLPA
jgi:hypothetical protein